MGDVISGSAEAIENQAELSAKPIPKRDRTVDIARGVAICLVVMGHANRGARDIKGDIPAYVNLLDWVIYTAHMPAFFLLAGYFTTVSLTRRTAAQFIRSRIAAIVWPYILWSIIFYLVGRIMQMITHINHPISIDQLVSIGWEPITVLWFLYALFILQIIGTLFKKYMLTLFLLSVSMDCILSVAGGSDQFGFAGRIMIHAPFFFGGLLLADRKIELSWPTGHIARWSIGLGGSFILCSAVSYGIAGINPVQFLTIPISALGIGAIFLMSQWIDKRSDFAALWIARLGQASLAVYLLHILVLALVPRLLAMAGMDNVLSRIIVGTIIGTGGSYAAYLIIERCKMTSFLGLR